MAINFIKQVFPLPAVGRRGGRGQGEGVKRTKESVARAKKLRELSTDAESKLWFLLKNRQFLNLKFRRQYAIGKYIVDFCCVEKKFIIELDGSQHQEQAEADSLRTDFLNAKGYNVLRFWDHDVLKDTDVVLESIRRTLIPSPLTASDPLPLKGERNKKEK